MLCSKIRRKLVTLHNPYHRKRGKMLNVEIVGWINLIKTLNAQQKVKHVTFVRRKIILQVCVVLRKDRQDLEQYIMLRAEMKAVTMRLKTIYLDFLVWMRWHHNLKSGYMSMNTQLILWLIWEVRSTWWMNPLTNQWNKNPNCINRILKFMHMEQMKMFLCLEVTGNGGNVWQNYLSAVLRH